MLVDHVGFQKSACPVTLTYVNTGTACVDAGTPTKSAPGGWSASRGSRRAAEAPRMLVGLPPAFRSQLDRL